MTLNRTLDRIITVHIPVFGDKRNVLGERVRVGTDEFRVWAARMDRGLPDELVTTDAGEIVTDRARFRVRHDPRFTWKAGRKFELGGDSWTVLGVAEVTVRGGQYDILAEQV